MLTGNCKNTMDQFTEANSKMTKFQDTEWKADQKESATKAIFYMDLKTETELSMHQMAAFTEASFWIIVLKDKEHLSEVMGVSTSAFGKRT